MMFLTLIWEYKPLIDYCLNVKKNLHTFCPNHFPIFMSFVIKLDGHFGLQLQQDLVTIHPMLQFIVQYLPSLTITVLNTLMPIVFKKLVLLENYSPAFEMRMTLLRFVIA